MGVEVADKIPIPHSGPQNPVAHDTESEAAEAPPQKVEKVKQEVLPPDAVKLKLHKEPKKAQAKEESVRKHLKSYDELEKNQLTARTPQAVSSPLFSQLPGSGRVGMGANTTLGTRFSGLWRADSGLDCAQLEDGRCSRADRARWWWRGSI